MRRRTFLGVAAAGMATALDRGSRTCAQETPVQRRGVHIGDLTEGEDVFRYVRRVAGQWDPQLYKQILGAANAFKEGDQIVGVAAADEVTRLRARSLLARTQLRDIDRHPPRADQLFALIDTQVNAASRSTTSSWTLGQLQQFLLGADEAAIHAIKDGLSSDVIGCVVKLMSDAELVTVGAKVFNPLPGSQLGAKGYLGARIQPNSPTDHVDDIRWQVLDGWAYAVGDVVLGTNPVSSESASVAAIEAGLQDLLVTFGLEDILPHCVLSHIDVQAEVERRQPGTTGIWFQSIAGSDTANATFDITIDKMQGYAAQRTGRFGLYFETGQGADFTNGHSHGYDMVLHESRKYGFARALSHQVAEARRQAGHDAAPWVHLNDVAGFIGPEVFRTREQLVRCCLEDIVMGKLHGLCLGLDVCSTLHMDVSLEDLDWCLDQVMPANPAYLMALPTKIDPMLGYLTTGYHDHVRLREKFGYRVNDPMWAFFQQLGILDAAGRPTVHFGDPVWVYLQYRRAKGDTRTDEEIRQEAQREMTAVRGRGVFLAEGCGRHHGDMPPGLAADVQRIYADAKESIWTELDPRFVATVPAVTRVSTRSVNRQDYILHPESGERLHPDGLAAIRKLRQQQLGKVDVQIVVSDGLNALAIMDPGHLEPYLRRVREQLARTGYRVGDQNILVTSGRVRAGYRIGETLFGDLPGNRALLHVIGERPGSGHHTFSVYLTLAPGATWGRADQVDHNITKVVSGIATTALLPQAAADETVRILGTLS